jgi:hypothetical protein
MFNLLFKAIDIMETGLDRIAEEQEADRATERARRKNSEASKTHRFTPTRTTSRGRVPAGTLPSDDEILKTSEESLDYMSYVLERHDELTAMSVDDLINKMTI